MPPQRGRRTRLGGKLGIPCADPNESALSNALRGIGRRRASIDHAAQGLDVTLHQDSLRRTLKQSDDERFEKINAIADDADLAM